MRKITLLMATLMLVLMATGITYAYWTDSLNVNTHVVTGTFGWELDNVQSWLWGDEKNIIESDDADFMLDTELPDQKFDAVLGDYDGDCAKQLVIEIVDFYPGILLENWFDIHYCGSIPGDLNEVAVEVTIDGEPCPLPDWLALRYRLVAVGGSEYPEGVTLGTWLTLGQLVSELEGTQWHQSYRLKVHMLLELIEPGMWEGVEVGEPPQGVSLRINLMINGVQYNFEETTAAPGWY